MAFTRSIYFLSTLVSLTQARHGRHLQHEVLEVQRRQEISLDVDLTASTTLALTPETTTTNSVLTYITPSAGATPVAVTQQSQVVTTYQPLYTLCALPSATFFPVTSAPYATAPYKNVTVSVEPDTTCSTVYASSETTVCATTLTALASKVPITACDQEVTFSSQLGFTVVTPTPTMNAKRQVGASSVYSNSTAMITPAPTIETVTTYYIADWTELTAGTVPSDVLQRVCSRLANGTDECVREQQHWFVTPVTITTSSVVSISFSTTIHGPSQVIVYETGVANVTEQLTTISLATAMAIEYVTEIEETGATAIPLSTSTGPTVYTTKTVEDATPAVTPVPGASETDTTSTTTLTMTSTIVGGTTTVTIDIPASPTPRVSPVKLLSCPSF